MNIVVAPDSFKGSISARDICTAVEKGVLRVFPQASVVGLPLADGGEGTMENLVYASGGSKFEVVVKGPLGKPVTASVGILGDKETVIIEMAQASGLTLVSENEKKPFLATSYGTGELIKYALDRNYRKFIIGLGGSATNDGGTGMLKALGVRFFSSDGKDLPEGGGALSRLDHFDDSGIDPRIKESSFIIASDVTNPLCGPNGASSIFGPQKGASPEDVTILDQALLNFSKIVQKQRQIDICQIVGGGAAGGMGAALVAFLQASIQSGIDVVMDAVQFGEKVKDANFIITGEGKLDSQTLSGKVIAGVSKMAKKHQIPVIALCGGLELDGNQMDELGIVSGFSIVPGPCTLEGAMEKSAKWMEERTEQIMRLVKVFS
ncbi:glycerate kinase [Bacillus suaedaesalsae]|uniref:Glycerate kinase n=1 Tax=Bacillus suaedaesalsae TaxID=2810349 RepID=A0ABS2DI09_9BACI|nr:glycerate kinase [Bacillus suaedaesalsae]MBM6618125.1 glycerate kinase [Bacillus suaedaesalsae]